MSTGVQTLESGQLPLRGYGASKWTLYKVLGEQQPRQPLNLFTFLHGLDDYKLPEEDMLSIDKHLGGNTLFLVPQNPRKYWYGKIKMGCEWGLTFKASDDRTSRGHCWGEVYTPYNEEFAKLVHDIKRRYTVDGKAIVYGYSAGGLGALLLGVHDPTLFEAIVAAASYAPGTLEEADDIPQPDSRTKFDHFLNSAKERLRDTRTYFVHFRGDEVSPFGDVAAMAEGLQEAGVSCELMEVSKRLKSTEGKKKSSHSYYYSTLIYPTAENFFWAKFREELCLAAGSGTPQQSARPSSVGQWTQPQQQQDQDKNGGGQAWRRPASTLQDSSSSNSWSGRGWKQSRWQQNWNQGGWNSQAHGSSWQWNRGNGGWQR